jgi:urease accessory protein
MLRGIFTGIAMAGAFVTPAVAHVGVDQTTSFSFGLAHPLIGPDHILAMVAVGLFGDHIAKKFRSGRLLN